jgi:hypothetical protein
VAPDSNTEQVRAQTLASQPRVAAIRHTREDVGGCEPMVAQLVRLVAEAANVPVVIASLITADRQVLVAGYGMSGPSTFGTEVPFARSLCDEVVAGGLPLIIGDVAGDHRFAGRRADGRQVGAYAGFPVRGDAGQVIGVLDLADYGPRRWSTRELASTDNAAQLFAGLLASPNASNARGRGEAERRQALTSAVLDSLDTGVAACDARDGLLLVNRAMRGILSGAESDDSRAGQWAALLHPHRVGDRAVPQPRPHRGSRGLTACRVGVRRRRDRIAGVGTPHRPLPPTHSHHPARGRTRPPHRPGRRRALGHHPDRPAQGQPPPCTMAGRRPQPGALLDRQHTAADMLSALMSLGILDRLLTDRRWSRKRIADQYAVLLGSTFVAAAE